MRRHSASLVTSLDNDCIHFSRAGSLRSVVIPGILVPNSTRCDIIQTPREAFPRTSPFALSLPPLAFPLPPSPCPFALSLRPSLCPFALRLVPSPFALSLRPSPCPFALSLRPSPCPFALPRIPSKPPVRQLSLLHRQEPALHRRLPLREQRGQVREERLVAEQRVAEGVGVHARGVNGVHPADHRERVAAQSAGPDSFQAPRGAER